MYSPLFFALLATAPVADADRTVWRDGYEVRWVATERDSCALTAYRSGTRLKLQVSASPGKTGIAFGQFAPLDIEGGKDYAATFTSDGEAAPLTATSLILKTRNGPTEYSFNAALPRATIVAIAEGRTANFGFAIARQKLSVSHLIKPENSAFQAWQACVTDLFDEPLTTAGMPMPLGEE